MQQIVQNVWECVNRAECPGEHISVGDNVECSEAQRIIGRTQSAWECEEAHGSVLDGADSTDSKKSTNTWKCREAL